MTRISSASTLFFAVFLPVFWMVFFGSLCLGMLMLDVEEIDTPVLRYARWVVPVLFVLFAFIIYRTLLRLRRVDADEDFIYVSNYLSTVRIPYAQISSLESKSLSVRLLARLHLLHKGRFGSSILFICETEKYLLLEERINRRNSVS